MPAGNDLDPATVDAIRRDLMMDLARGIRHGFYAYPLLLAVLWSTSTLPTEHPRVWWTAAIWLTALNLLRIVLVLRREQLYDRWPEFWRYSIEATTLAVLAGFGLLLTFTGICYNLDDWNLQATLVFAIGIAAGAMITLTPCYPLMMLNPIVLFVPGTIAAACKGGNRAAGFAIVGTVFVSFLLVQGRTLHRSSIELRWEQAVCRESAHGNSNRPAATPTPLQKPRANSWRT